MSCIVALDGPRGTDQQVWPFNYHLVDKDWQEHACRAVGLRFKRVAQVAQGGPNVALRRPKSLIRNGSDCGVLALAMAFDWCAGHDPSGIIFDHKKIRQHLKNSLESCSISRFPIISTRRAVRRRTKMTTVPIHCTCRMPHDDDPDNPRAECTSCHFWYHKNCVDVPEINFSERKHQLDVSFLQSLTLRELFYPIATYLLLISHYIVLLP